MMSFESGVLERQPITHGLLRVLRSVGEYRGKQGLFREQAPQVLRTLRQAAVIESTEASNRIEGVVAPTARIRKLVEHKTEPRNRSEQEIAGYRDVLSTIHVNHAGMRFTPGLVLQLHRDLYQFTSAEGGRWKPVDNEISETLPDGTRRLRFRTVPAYWTPDAMRELHTRFERAWAEEEVEPLLLIGAYVLDFLCIHPFLDGNGRMARLLTLLLLYRAGYEVGRFISLEGVVERTRESYYDTLHSASQGWHEGEHSLLPWWEYFLGVVLLTAYRDFEQRIGSITTARGSKREMVLDVVGRLSDRFQYEDVERACLGVSRPTINRTLAELRRAGAIRLLKPGRDALWEKT